MGWATRDLSASKTYLEAESHVRALKPTAFSGSEISKMFTATVALSVASGNSSFRQNWWTCITRMDSSSGRQLRGLHLGVTAHSTY